jgi:carbon-monoxide dehydrogenase medium subunit
MLQDQIFLRPDTLAKAVDYLAEYPQATLWAGGTDLVVKLEHKRLKVSEIIDLTNIPELKYIEDAGDYVRIGALTSIYDIQVSPLIKKEFPLLAQAALVLGSWQVRTLATVGGNIVTAAPSAETACPILILGGTIIVEGKNGERKIAADQFFKGPGQTYLEAGEIVKEIQLPKLAPGYQTIYIKERLRRSMDIALVNVACVLKLDGDKIEDVHIGLGAVAPTPMRAVKTEAVLKGRTLSNELIHEAAMAAMNECTPITDIRATAEYRRHLIHVSIERALETLWKAGAK